MNHAISMMVRLRGKERALNISPLWLRLNDPAKFTPNGQRQFEIADVVQNSSSTTVVQANWSELATNYQHPGLEVDWADGSRSFFPSDWLEENVMAFTEHPSRSKAVDKQYLWNSQFEKFKPHLQTSYGNFADHGERSNAGKLRVASHLSRYGLAVLSGVPTGSDWSHSHSLEEYRNHLLFRIWNGRSGGQPYRLRSKYQLRQVMMCTLSALAGAASTVCMHVDAVFVNDDGFM
jgi:hypothetical protein